MDDRQETVARMAQINLTLDRIDALLEKALAPQEEEQGDTHDTNADDTGGDN